MLIVGERINSTRKRIEPAVRQRDAELIKTEATMQAEAGADYIDCNAAIVGVDEEPEALCWLVETVQSVVDLPCALDSPNPAAIRAALEVHKGVPMINSISGEKEKLENLLPVAIEGKMKVIALCMDDSGMPCTAADRVRIARSLVIELDKAGLPRQSIYLDPLILPVGTDPNSGNEILATMRALRDEMPDVTLICGLSNISYGLPQRKLINRAFMALCIGCGLGAAILDPTDQHLMALAAATEALTGTDEWCANYIKAARAGKFDTLA